MSSRKRSRSPSSHSSKERSGKHRKSSKRRRSHDDHCGTDTTSTSGNPVAFTELLKQMSGISQAVTNLSERLTNLETAAASNGPGRSNNNVNVQAMAASESPVVTQAGEASFSNEINSMDQLSVVVTQDPDLIDPIAPETLETDLGHGDGPQTSESLNNDSTLSTKVKQSGQSLEEKLGHDESALKGQLFDPVDHDPSWATSDSFKSFLETNFRRSLSSSQIFSILEQTSLPDLDVFTTPKLDKTIIDQVPSQFKKSVEIRDKELLKVQRDVLNVAAPLTALHDLLENNQTVSVTETLGIVEKALCLLGSASNSLSVLRRYKVLYAINPKKVSLAEASYPNAEKQLFGSDITKIASERADITRNLQKNLSQSHSYSNNRFQFGKYQSKNDKFRPHSFRHQKFAQAKKRPFQQQPFQQQPFRQNQRFNSNSH